MGAALGITRTDHTSGELRALSSQCSDAAQVRRILALAMVLEGRARSEAASLAGMDRQTACDWVHRYNTSGVAGLKSRHPPGRVPALTEKQKAEFRALVVKGPDAAADDVARWRCADLQTVVARRFSVNVHVHTIGKWLNQFSLTRLQPRPVHPKKGPEAEVTFQKLCQPGQDDAAQHHRGHADRDLVPEAMRQDTGRDDWQDWQRPQSD
jgi:transposase